MKARHADEAPISLQPDSPSADPVIEASLRSERRARGTRQLVIGGLALVGGLVITGLTRGRAAREGGTYILAYGPIGFGIISIIRGMIALGG